MSIVVFGSVNIDVTAYVETLPRAGVTSHATGQLISLGGKGANQAVAARKLGTGAVRFVAATGRDGFGAMAREFLLSFGVACDDLVTREDAATGIALIHVDAKSQNTITVIGGANMAWKADEVDAAVFAGAKVALFQLETPNEATAAAMRAARDAGAIVVLDPAPAPDHPIDELLALADIVTPNEMEAAALTGNPVTDAASATVAAHVLLAKGPAAAVVKLGARGLVYATRSGEEEMIEPFAVEAIDSVAAGDSFNGGLAAALAEGQPFADALRFAAAAGALATTRKGAAASIPAREEVLGMVAGSSGD